MYPLGSNFRTLGSGALIPLSFAVGASLGALAVAADELELPGGRFVLVLVSTGFSWGAGATVVGVFGRNVRVAAVGGSILPLTAVWTYYGTNHFLGLREVSGASSVVVAAWGGVAVVGGALLGALGWLARAGSERRRALARGGLCGLLLGQGIAWAIKYGLTPDPVFTPALVGPLLLFLFVGRGLPVIPGVAALVIASAISGVGWAVIELAT